MAKSPFNIQDQYLNQARKERVKVVRQFLRPRRQQWRLVALQARCFRDYLR